MASVFAWGAPSMSALVRIRRRVTLRGQSAVQSEVALRRARRFATEHSTDARSVVGCGVWTQPPASQVSTVQASSSSQEPPQEGAVVDVVLDMVGVVVDEVLVALELVTDEVVDVLDEVEVDVGPEIVVVLEATVDEVEDVGVVGAVDDVEEVEEVELEGSDDVEVLDELMVVEEVVGAVEDVVDGTVEVVELDGDGGTIRRPKAPWAPL